MGEARPAAPRDGGEGSGSGLGRGGDAKPGRCLLAWEEAPPGEGEWPKPPPPDAGEGAEAGVPGEETPEDDEEEEPGEEAEEAEPGGARMRCDGDGAEGGGDGLRVPFALSLIHI